MYRVTSPLKHDGQCYAPGDPFDGQAPQGLVDDGTLVLTEESRDVSGPAPPASVAAPKPAAKAEVAAPAKKPAGTAPAKSGARGARGKRK